MKSKRIFAAAAILCLLLMLIPAVSFADDSGGTCGDNVRWRVSGEAPNMTLVIEGTGAMADYNENPSLGSRPPWYSYARSIKSVRIEENVTTIGDYAFDDFVVLTDVRLPDSLKTIGSGAFEGCTALKSILLGSNITQLGAYAFSGCSSLEGIAIPESVQSIYMGCFINCTKLASVNIPYGVSVINRTTFQECRSLTEITIPNSVTNIEDYAFLSCSKLTYINILSGVSTIGAYAFGEIAASSIKLPYSVTKIEEYAFKCPNLVSIELSNNLNTIGEQAFGYSGNSPIPGFEITGYADTAAEAYANSIGFAFNTKTYDHICNNVKYDKAILPSGGTLSAGNYYLDTDVRLTNNLTVNSGVVNLCLNNHELKGNGAGSVISISGGATLNIYDCGTKGKITGGRATVSARSAYGGGIYAKDSNLNMYGGTITGNKVETEIEAGHGGAICLEKTNIKLKNVKIEDNSADYTGAIHGIGNKTSRNTAEMADCTIVDNTSGSFSVGGVYLDSGYSLKLSGKMMITNNWTKKPLGYDERRYGNLWVDNKLDPEGLHEDARIGLSNKELNGDFLPCCQSRTIYDASSTDYSDRFSTDTADYTLIKGADNSLAILSGHWEDGRWDAIAPTCTTGGRLQYYKCKKCSAIYPYTTSYYTDKYEPSTTDPTEYDLPALNHSFSSSWTIDREATCLEKGSKSHHCIRCDEKADITELPLGPHDWNEGRIIKEATATATGEKICTCNVCNTTKTFIIPKKAETAKIPKKAETASGTGDHSNIGLWFILLAAAAFGLMTILIKRKHKH